MTHAIMPAIRAVRLSRFVRTSNVISFVWAVIFGLMLLTLLPSILDITVLNVLFGYLLPYALLIIGLITQMILGRRYRRTATDVSSDLLA